MIVGSCNTNTLEIKLVGALSPVNHEGLHQGCLKNTLKFFFWNDLFQLSGTRVSFTAFVLPVTKTNKNYAESAWAQHTSEFEWLLNIILAQDWSFPKWSKSMHTSGEVQERSTDHTQALTLLYPLTGRPAHWNVHPPWLRNDGPFRVFFLLLFSANTLHTSLPRHVLGATDSDKKGTKVPEKIVWQQENIHAS